LKRVEEKHQAFKRYKAGKTDESKPSGEPFIDLSSNTND
jgi:hypothetical protein